MPNSDTDHLWGVVFIDHPEPAATPRLEAILQILARHTASQLIVSPCPEKFLSFNASVLAPRRPNQGDLGYWLNVWQDTPAPAMLLLNLNQPDERLAARLAAGHGKYKILASTDANGHPRPVPAYYNRASMGAGLRLWRQGVRELAVLLKVLNAAALSAAPQTLCV